MFARIYQSDDSPFGPEERDAFGLLAQTKIHPAARSTIMGEDDGTNFCLFIESGLVKVLSGRTAGKGSRFAGLRGPGDLVGEKAAILRKPRTHTIVALTDIEALWIPGSQFRDYCVQQHPEILPKLWAIDEERRQEEVDWSNESPISKDQRFAKLLVYLVSKGLRQETEDGIVVKSPQSELAEFMNLSRESLSPVVQRFKGNNVIEVTRGQTMIRDWRRLEQIAAGEFTTAP